MNLIEWIDKKVKIGVYADADFILKCDYDVIINVSDEADLNFLFSNNLNSQKYFWLPMNEAKKDIGLNNIAAVAMILNKSFELNKSVYLHCHGGANRSPMCLQAFYYAKSGTHLDGNRENPRWDNELIRSSMRGYLPPRRELEKFLSAIGKRFGKNCMDLDKAKYDNLFNF